MSTQKPKLIVVCGTNASGKSSLGVKLASMNNGEIISADSRQVFKGFDLCCGKITPEEMNGVPHHMLNIREVSDTFSVADYQTEVYGIIREIINKGKTPFLVGGTGLYVSSVVHGYSFPDEKDDPAYREYLESRGIDELIGLLPVYERTRMNNDELRNKRRVIRTLEKIKNGEPTTPINDPQFDCLMLGVTWPREQLNVRIDERLGRRLEQGMINEVANYLENGGQISHMYRLGLEYKQIAMYLEGRYSSIDEMSIQLGREIKRFAKRQMTWFKREKDIKWVDMNNDPINEAQNLIVDFLNP